ncbi:MAG TPA: PQQ-binding-like beta-propeller repeat protein, partial [Streptosporangiaceae bacterium]
MRRFTMVAAAGVSLALLTGARAADPTGVASPAPPQPTECCAPTGADMPKYGGDYGNQDYSSLTAITPANVHNLRGAWVRRLETTPAPDSQESTPVAVGGNLYVQTSQGDIFAINGATGRLIWEYKSGLPGVQRGVAIAGGRVFSALGGSHVVALNQQTGAVIWMTQVGTPGQDTPAQGAGLPWTEYYHGLVLVGTENGDAGPIRGHLYALHATDGSPAWSFAGTAGPDQGSANKTWAGNSWKLGGGDAWIAPAVDPQLGLIYMTFANPEPSSAGGLRAGDNLYTNSIVALRWSTGRIVWHFQSVHHDLWDYDNEMSPVIASVRYPSGVRKVVIYGSKSAWLYYLDAKTGKPVIPVQEKAVPQMPSLATSPTQPIPAGDSLIPTCPQKTGPTQVIPGYLGRCVFAPYGNQPIMVSPGRGGGANWALMSFDRQTGLLYVPASEVGAAFSSGQPYGQPTGWAPEGEIKSGVLDAINPSTNKIVWQKTTRYSQANGDGIVTTASGMLFEGSPDGLFYARSAATGKILWTWQTGTGIKTTPTTYVAHGRQYISVLACAGATGLPCSLWAFRLGGTVGPARGAPNDPVREPILGPTIAGSTVADTVVMGRTWDSTANGPSATENLGSQV